MNDIVIPIDGVEIKISRQKIDINKLDLDQENPRISFFKDNQVVPRLTQEQILFALTGRNPESFRKLKDSIHNNRGIINPIWIQPQGERFLVIEGNTRVVVYLKLSKDEPYELRWKQIDSYVLPKEVREEQKNFIKLTSHLRGVTEWDAYEKAKYLYKLWDIDGWSIPRLEKQTKLSEREIKSSIDAYRIMDQQYLGKCSGAEPNEVFKFSYFVEYVKDTKLSEVMENQSLSVEDFCGWVADKDKIPKAQDVRRLRDIVSDVDARTAFLNEGFEAAIQILSTKKPHLVSGFYRDVETVIDGLKSISTREIDEIVAENGGEREAIIKNLSYWSHKVEKMIESEKNGK